MSTELARRDTAIEIEPVAAGPMTLWRSEEPGEIIQKATKAATALADVVRKQKLAVGIQGREHVRVEGWTLLGSMLGVFAVCEWTKQVENGWEARVEAKTLAGQVVGAAEAQCLRSESTWKNRDDYALRSMAQTRATSKALRQPLGFVMTLAGFAATPFEEMPHNEEPKPAPAAAKPATTTKASKKQLDEIKAIAGSLEQGGVLSDAAFLQGLEHAYGVNVPQQLSKEQADDLIERLKKRYKDAAEASDESAFKAPTGAAA